MSAVETIRAKIAALKPEDCCSPTCPTWAVFDTNRGWELDICLDCWSGVPVENGLKVDELDELPEAEDELGYAHTDGDAYRHPIAGPMCKCGRNYNLWRQCSTGDGGCVHCIACSEMLHEQPAPVTSQKVTPIQQLNLTLGGSLETYLNERHLTLMSGCRGGHWWARVVHDGYALLRPDGPGTYPNMLSALMAAIAEWEVAHPTVKNCVSCGGIILSPRLAVGERERCESCANPDDSK